LNTVKRNLQDKRYREKQKEKKEEHSEEKSKSFLTQEFHLSDYVNLPEGTVNILIFIAFLLIPYTVGISFIFFIVAGASLETFEGIDITEYSIYWAIGYEVIAVTLLLLIFKSAINFRKFKKDEH
ncbi:MAG: hypothetical protein K0U38_03335, partial [Epsilonproteobacteria bacterium]|nr:hypothetical protein [Campylobacterota bacterium]